MPDILRPTVLRRLSADDAPIPGDLLAGEPPLVWTASGEWSGSPAWRAHPDGHVLAPVDCGRSAVERGVLVPHCIAPLGVLLHSDHALSDGEVVTVAVSILRGSREADDLHAAHGRWWVTADGRPVLALVGDTPWRAESQSVVATLAHGRSPSLVSALQACGVALGSPQLLRRGGEECESALFDTALAEPMQMSGAPRSSPPRVPGPTPMRTPEVGALTSRAEPSRADAPAARSASDASTLRRVADHFDGDIAVRIHTAWRSLTELRGRAAPSKPRDRPVDRVRVAVCAATAAVAVIIAGLLLPADEPRADDRIDASEVDAVAEERGPSLSAAAPTPSAAPTNSASPAPGGAGDARDALLDSAGSVLGALAECAEASCRALLLEDAQRSLPAGVATDSDSERALDIIDDYGAVVVIRVEDIADQHPEQIAVFVRSDDEWLIRDIFDVADQP